MLMSFYHKNVCPNVSSSPPPAPAEPFQYAGWELNLEDYEEETEDYQAEAEIDEELGEEEEEEEEVCVSRHCKRAHRGWK